MEELMEKLWSCLPSREDEARTINHRIIQHFHSGLTTEERDVSLHTYFHYQDDRGIRSFIEAAASNKLKKLVADIFSFFVVLFEYFPDGLENYVPIIKDTCLSCIKRDATSDEKDKALEALRELIKCGPWSCGLDIPSLINQLRKMASCRVSKSTVLKKVYMLVGTLAEHLPHEVEQHSKLLLKALLLDLDYQITASSKVEFPVIEGCFEGLTGLLHWFPIDKQVESDLCKRISDYTQKVLKVQEVWRRTAAKAALNFLGVHGDQLRTSLITEYQSWHSLLRSWLSQNKDERALAKQALLTFYRVLSNYSSTIEKKEVLLYFSRHFKEQFEKSEDVDIVIKGFGLFAGPMKLHTPNEIPIIFNVLAQRSQEETGKQNHHKSADYLDSLSVLSAELGVIHSLQLAILEGLSVHLIAEFAAEEHPSWQAVMVDAVIWTVLRLYRSSGSALDMYLNTVVYQGIIRTVSHPVVQDAEILNEAGVKRVKTFQDYLPFWQKLSSLTTSGRQSSVAGIPIEERREVSKKLLDKIIISVMEVIDRLDLTLSADVLSEPIFHCNVEKCLEARNPTDFTVLVNLIDFVVALLSSLPDQSMLTNWIGPLIQYNVMLSVKNPLVSSFYKWLSNIMLIAQKVSYFDVQEGEMEDVEWRSTINLLSGFLHDVIGRQAQYQGELQVVCLRLMLATPSCIATPLLKFCDTAFQSVFRIGCSMLSLAQEGLQTLSRWNQEIPKEKMKFLLQSVLPLFDSLLQTKDNVPEGEDEVDLTGMAMVKKVLQDKKRNRLWKLKVSTHTDTELVQLQKEVVLFLSTLDSSTCLSLLDGYEKRDGITSWQKEKFLLFPLPFPDVKVEISLDDMLPRLADLAVNCSDRQTRSAACEFLHGVIMYMLGKEKQLEIAHAGRLTPLWINLFPKIFSLACDLDLVISQLFKPMGEQLAHWFSSKNHQNSEQSEAFLKALLDGITNQTDGALRDYSSTCLHEYVMWSRKQGQMTEKVKPIIKLIISLCHHPCPQKRMGAALAFNSMYTVLREEQKIVDEFWLELLHSLVVGLSLCSLTGEDSHAEELIEKSLRHILRVLIEYSNKFNLESNARRTPRDLGGKTLFHVARWLLKYCTSLNSKCRNSCMFLVDKLAPYIPDCRSTRDFIMKVITNEDLDILVMIAEGEDGLLTYIPSNAQWDKALKWVNALVASMDSYLWLLQRDMPPQTVLTLDGSKLILALNYLLDGIVNSAAEKLSLWRPKAMEHFNLAKCTAIVRMMEFLTAVLDRGQAAIVDSLWTANFMQTVKYCCVWPSYLGFDSTSRSIEENLPNTLEKFLKAILCHAPVHALQGLKTFFRDFIALSAPEFLRGFSESLILDKVSSKDRDLVRGLKVLQKVFEEAHSWSGLGGTKALDLVFESIVKPVLNSDTKAPVTLGPKSEAHAKSVLELYFITSSEITPVIMLSTDGSHLSRPGLQGDLTRGEHFVASFEGTLVGHILRTPQKSIEIFEDLLSPNITPRHLTMLSSLFSSQRRYSVQNFTLALFSKWSSFSAWSEGDCAKEAWLVSLLCQIVKQDNKYEPFTGCEKVIVWVVKLLTDPSRTLPFKTDLLQCLPILCSNVTSSNSNLKTVLQDLKDQHFPLKCSELKLGTEQFISFVRAFEALLQSLVLTGNCVMLQYVVKMMSIDSNHACCKLLPSTLKNFMGRLHHDPDRQKESLKLVFSMFDNESQSIDVRMRILNSFLLQLMQSASHRGQVLFAKEVIKRLINVISDRTFLKNEDDARGKQKVVSQIGSWSLLQQIYTSPVQSQLEEKGGEIVIAAFTDTDTVVTDGKELTKKITARALEVFKSVPKKEKWSNEFKELFRVYLCTAYNMFATLISNLKTAPSDLKFYEKFLFDEKTRYIWRELVDSNKIYMLPYENTEHLKNVERVVTIRRQVNAEKPPTGKQDIKKTLHLFESQSAFAGSLESDITRFDFSHSRVLSVSGEKESEEKSIIVLENDSLNDHECMATVCGVVCHLVDSGMCPLPLPDTNPKLPGWMESLKLSLLDKTCPRNSSIFLLRVILNCENYFSPYASHWIQPIIDCIVKNCLVESGISYLLGDIVCLLVKWCASNPLVDVSRYSANKLLHYLVEKCYSPKKSVFKYHLELIRSVLEVWKDHIDPPHLLLENMLKHVDKKVGINLTAIMLFYNLAPWTDESKGIFLEVLAKNLQDSNKDTFKASSETLGLSLKFLSQKNGNRLSPDDEDFVAHLSTYLKNVHVKQRDCDRFLTVLHGIHESYPEIVDSLAPTILFYLDQTTDDKKAVCLSLLASRLQILGENVDAYRDLKGRGLLKMLNDRNSDVQIKALQILKEVAPSLLERELYEVIHELSAVNRYVKSDARHLAFEISLGAFDQYSLKKASSALSDIESKILEESKALLLLGLVDPNIDLQKKSFSQWTKEERLPLNVSERITTIFALMYSPLTEEHFLSYSVPLILEGTAGTPDFQSVVFQHGLEECTYNDVQLDSSWRCRNVPMAPMYAQTYSSQILKSDSLNSSLSESSFQILATQNSLIFQPTMDTTSVDVIDGSKSQMKVNNSFTKSSFLFSQEYGSPRNSTSFKQGAGFGAHRLKFHNEPDIPAPGPSHRTHRFMGKNTAGKVHAIANVRKAKMRNEMWKERSRKREGQVALYRKYRRGDYPDIQLKFSDFINPLKELVKRDTACARIIMVNLFMGVQKVLSDVDSAHDFEDLAKSLLSEVFKLSETYVPSAIGACLEVAYHCKLKINANLISEAAKNSDLLSLGVLLLESVALDSGADENIWLYIAELYDGLGERDVAHATLLHNVALGEVSKSALEAHSEEQWVKAKKLYYHSLAESKYDNFYESCFECMAVLSEWKGINELIREEVDQDLDNLWDGNWYEKKLLPRLLHSELLSIVETNTDERNFMKVINKWLVDDVKSTTLKEYFCETLSVLCLLKKNFPQSRFYGGKTLSKFINDWNELSPLFRKRREALLMNIHNIAETMRFFSGSKEIQSPEDCLYFLNKLEKVLPVSQDSLIQWETRISYRMACMKQMPECMKSKVIESSYRMKLSLIEAALKQGNQNFAKKYISSIKSVELSSHPVLHKRWLLAKCQERHQWAANEKDLVMRLNHFLDIWKQLDHIVFSQDLSKNPELSVTAHSAESNVSYSIRCLLSQQPNLLRALEAKSSSNYAWICEKLQLGTPHSSFEIISLLEMIGHKSLVHSQQQAKRQYNKTPNESLMEQTAEAYFQIALYCRRILESLRDPHSAEGTDQHAVTFSKSLVKSTLSAMKYGSNRARQLFPLLLQLPNLSSDLSKEFKEKSAVVPVWMFLGWIPQMLALLDSPSVDVISPLLLNIAQKYPNAVSYPYNITKENFKKSSGNLAIKNVFDELDKLLMSDALHIQLVRALSCLTYPSIIVKYHIDKFERAFTVRDWESMNEVCDTLFKEILFEDAPCEKLGNFFKSLSGIHVLFNELRAALIEKSLPDLSNILARIKKALEETSVSDSKHIKNYVKLKDFSPWLHSFSSSKLNVNIEVPGQYTGEQKPAPERHIMISQFHETVQVMSSLRKPVKLTVIGSDAKNYDFLVKFGEDLRQDERIQQLLSLMNGIFSNNHQCRVRQASVVTYKVVPMSSRLGLIEWVYDTSSLKEIMLSSCNKEEIESMTKNIIIKYRDWLFSGHEDKDSLKIVYGDAHKNFTNRESSSKFSEILSMTRSDLLRKGLALWSSSAQAYYWLRHSFITSYSTLCISHWVLGVGDRHLSNCLISNKNGKCIGIDFGHVFGSATQFLPVPELVPFRLTPHIVDLVQPLGTKGLIEETMVKVLRALQADSEVLLATMQVFIQEPSLDWLLYSRKNFEENEDNPTWLPALKVQQANRKLKGVNPVIIVKEDIAHRCYRGYKEDFCRTAVGDRRNNIRAQLPEEGLTTRQQIESLIDLATDHNVLIKTYMGWEPWM